jgi:hypothetical protein
MRGDRTGTPIGRTSRPICLVLAALLAGCGSNEAGQSTVTTTVAATTVTQPVTVTQPATSTEPGTTTAPVIPPSTVDGIDPLDDAAASPVTAPATNADTALLTDVKAARHEGYDRVVFVFRNAVPGYDVRYVERPIVQDGSGNPVDVGGAYVLRVRMDNALDADLSQETAPPTYTGPSRFSPGTLEIVELVRTGGFEGVLTWAMGLNDRVDFRVLTLQDPPRLIVDVRNH